MSGVVVEVRVKEGQEIMKGDPLCGKEINRLCLLFCLTPTFFSYPVLSAMKVRVKCFKDGGIY